MWPLGLTQKALARTIFPSVKYNEELPFVKWPWIEEHEELAKIRRVIRDLFLCPDNDLPWEVPSNEKWNWIGGTESERWRFLSTNARKYFWDSNERYPIYTIGQRKVA